MYGLDRQPHTRLKPANAGYHQVGLDWLPAHGEHTELGKSKTAE